MYVASMWPKHEASNIELPGRSSTASAQSGIEGEKTCSEARALLSHTVDTLQATTVEHIATTAWLLDETVADDHGIVRTPQDKIQIKLVEEGQCEETPMKDLPTLVEGNRRGARRGTKRAILSGAAAFSGNITQQRSEPRLHLGQDVMLLLRATFNT